MVLGRFLRQPKIQMKRESLPHFTSTWGHGGSKSPMIDGETHSSLFILCMYIYLYICICICIVTHTHVYIIYIYIYIFTYGHVSMCCSLHGCVKHSDTLYLSGGAVTHAWPNQLTNSMARQSMIAGVQPATLLIIASKLIWIFQCLRVEYLQLYLHGGGARKREIQRDDVYIYIYTYTHTHI